MLLDSKKKEIPNISLNLKSEEWKWIRYGCGREFRMGHVGNVASDGRNVSKKFQGEGASCEVPIGQEKMWYFPWTKITLL